MLDRHAQWRSEPTNTHHQSWKHGVGIMNQTVAQGVVLWSR